jgi:hypothetical protein
VRRITGVGLSGTFAKSNPPCANSLFAAPTVTVHIHQVQLLDIDTKITTGGKAIPLHGWNHLV